jgi:transposase-like protein
MTARKKSARRRYTDDFRAKAVAACIAAGYPEKEGALSRTARQFEISHQLLRGWVTATQNPPPQGVLQEKKADLRAMLDDEIHSILGELPGKRPAASYMSLATALGIFVDKTRLLGNLPTEIIGVTGDFAVLASQKGIDPVKALQDYMLVLSRRPDATADEKLH